MLIVWWIWNVRLKWNAFLKFELFSSGGFHLWRSMGGIKIHGAIHGSALIIELPEGLPGCFPGNSPSVYNVQLLSASCDLLDSYVPLGKVTCCRAFTSLIFFFGSSSCVIRFCQFTTVQTCHYSKPTCCWKWNLPCKSCMSDGQKRAFLNLKLVVCCLCSIYFVESKHCDQQID